MNTIIKVCAAILVRKKQFLIAQRGPKDHLAGQWELPGGKIERNETPEQCLARELKEELNIQVLIGSQVGTRIHHYNHISIELLVFYAKIQKGQIILNEHANYCWVDKGKLTQFEFSAADVYFINKIKHGEIII
ncbi:MAG: (deoxy)nucleoside triphosphate pyrophosphohydrolase [Desulfobacteraceae bacterium]|jgi:8-oxo-dGTP diphosphatase